MNMGTSELWHSTKGQLDMYLNMSPTGDYLENPTSLWSITQQKNRHRYSTWTMPLWYMTDVQRNHLHMMLSRLLHLRADTPKTISSSIDSTVSSIKNLIDEVVHERCGPQTASELHTMQHWASHMIDLKDEISSNSAASDLLVPSDACELKAPTQGCCYAHDMESALASSEQQLQDMWDSMPFEMSIGQCHGLQYDYVISAAFVSGTRYPVVGTNTTPRMLAYENGLQYALETICHRLPENIDTLLELMH